MEITRLSTNTPLDKILGGGLEAGAVTNVFGPPGSGKTNVALITTLECENKAVYIDTEGSFSLERFQQIGGDDGKLKKVVLMEPTTWNEQNQCVAKLARELQKEKVDLIVVDSLVALYRLEISDTNFRDINRELATQYSILSKLARQYNIPILVTNQVYSKPANRDVKRDNAESDEHDGGDEVELTSRTIARYWSKCLVELKRKDRFGMRTAILRKHRSMPEGKSVDFEITAKGLKEVKLGIF